LCLNFCKVGSVGEVHNSKHSLVIVSTLVLRLKAAEYLPETNQCTLRTTACKWTKIRITRYEKRRFYPVLAKIRIKKSG